MTNVMMNMMMNVMSSDEFDENDVEYNDIWMILKIKMINNFSEFQLLARQIATEEGGTLELSSRSQEL